MAFEITEATKAPSEEEKKDDDEVIDNHQIRDRVKSEPPQLCGPFAEDKKHQSQISEKSVRVDENSESDTGYAYTIRSKSEKEKKSPLLLLLCAIGITSCYLWYGTLQESLFTRRHQSGENEKGDDAENDSITLFLLATGTLSSVLLAWVWTLVGPFLLSSSGTSKTATIDNGSKKQGLNHPLLFLTSVTYLTAMAASNESLHYVSYPTCVLAKSSKLIPTMAVGWMVDSLRAWRSHGIVHTGGKSHSKMEWVGALLITIGVLSFQYTQLQKQQTNASPGNNEKEAQGDSPYGLALLGLSLFMDGLLGACQNALKQKDVKRYTSQEDERRKRMRSDEKRLQPSQSSPQNRMAKSSPRPPTAMETMLYINLYATFVLIPASYYAGQFQHGMSMLFPSSSSATTDAYNKSTLLLKLNLSASMGQVFIFLTIHHFSPLICTTITTTRKFFTILLSVYKVGHVLDGWQWSSVGLVFGGLYLEIESKIFEKAEDALVGGAGDGARKAGKKKKE